MGSGRKLGTTVMVLIGLLLFHGCEGITDDLAPSSSDQRLPIQPGTTGPGVGQVAPDFTLSDSLGNPESLSASISAAKGVVLYFTMWCPICDAHMSHMRDTVIPAYPDVRFFAVDYVSGSVAGARASELANGYGGSGFMVLADIGGNVLHAYDATMGTTVVIDNAGVIRMNEDYRSGGTLQAVLGSLP